MGLLLWLPGKSDAQRVLYSESISSRASIRLQLIGKSENNYWVARLLQQKIKSHTSQERRTEIQDFELFDNRLHLISEESPIQIAGTVKQWLLTGNHSLDQIMTVPSGKNMSIFCNRYQPNQTPESRLIDSFPF